MLKVALMVSILPISWPRLTAIARLHGLQEGHVALGLLLEIGESHGGHVPLDIRPEFFRAIQIALFHFKDELLVPMFQKFRHDRLLSFS